MSLRDTGRTPKLLGIDARTLVGFLPFIFHISKLTFWLAVAFVVFFAILGYMGYTPDILWGRFLSWMGGSVREAEGGLSGQATRLRALRGDSYVSMAPLRMPGQRPPKTGKIPQ